MTGTGAIRKMPQQAQVTSVEAIEAFRSRLILYLNQARPAVEEVSNDVLRTRLWVQNDQRQHWERELRNRGKKLEQVRNELFSARLSPLQAASSVEQLAVQRAEAAVREAEARLAVLKKWGRELENRSEPLLKQVDALHNFLTTEIPRAVVQLAQVVKTLESYADVPGPTGATGPGAGKGDTP
jgi:hypothetical protein